MKVIQAAQNAQTLGDKVQEALGSLERKFRAIDQLCATFPDNTLIEEDSIKLVANVFKAIEDSIGYFTAPRGKNVKMLPVSISPLTDQPVASKARQAIFKGGDNYQKELKESLKRVESSMEELIKQAHIVNMHMSQRSKQSFCQKQMERRANEIIHNSRT